MDKATAERELIAIVHKEIEDHDKGQFWITDKVAFNMREMIKEFRKMYWGIFDEHTDPVSGREKTWVPLTRLLVDSVRKTVDMDPKDVRFRSKNPKKTHITHLVRGYVRDLLSRRRYSHTMNQDIFRLSIDGTSVRKTYTENGNILWNDVDVMNCYIDPTADDIQSAYRFTERLLMTTSEVKKMEGWENTEKFKTEKDLESQEGNVTKKTGEYGDVYDFYGKIPKILITLDDNDADKEIDAHIVVSGFDTGAETFHLVEENINKDKDGNVIKPYEEAWYIKVPGCWYGVSIPWMVMQLQQWINTTVNLRIAKNQVAQLGLLKIRKGSGVTQQMLSNLISKGVIELNDPERDVQNMPIAEAGDSSYRDEETAKNWAQEVTSIFDLNLGDLPASTSATGAVIQDRQNKSAFALIAESYEDFTQRWLERHVLPNLPAMMKKDKNAQIYKDVEDMKQIREQIVSNLALKALENSTVTPTEEELAAAMEEANKKLERRGDLMITLVDDIIANQLETEVFMTNAELDVAVTVRNLLELRNGVPQEAAIEMTKEALDLLGIRSPDSLNNPVVQPQEQGQPGQIASEQVQATAANTINSEQR